MELKVLNIKGQETGRKVQLPEDIFGIEPNDNAIYLDVKQYLANQRQGTHSSLEKSTISGSTRKLFKQKGTGGARRGSIKSPLLRGGATVFGPQPRDYSFKLNKKLKRLARKSVLSHKAKEDNIIIVEDFNFDKPQTKQYVTFLKNLNITDKKSLLVLPESNENVFLSSRNIQRANVANAMSLNTYTLLHTNVLVISESSLERINEMFGE